MLVAKSQGARIVPFRNLGDSTDDFTNSGDTSATQGIDQANLAAVMAAPGGAQAVPLAQSLAAQEQSIWVSYQMLMTMASSVPDAQISSQLVDVYNDAQQTFVAAAQDWVAAHQAASAAQPDQVQDAGAVPIYPPVLNSGVAVGANTPIAISQVTVSYGYSGSEQTTALADQTVWNFSPQARGVNSNVGLGGLEIGVLILVGLVVAGLAIIAYFINQTVQSLAASKTAESQAKAQTLQQAITAANSALQQCAGIQDASQRSSCIQAALKTIQTAASSAGNQEKIESLGILGTVGLVVLVAGAAIIGFKIYTRRRDSLRDNPKPPRKALAPGPPIVEHTTEPERGMIPAGAMVNGRRRKQSRSSRRWR